MLMTFWVTLKAEVVKTLGDHTAPKAGAVLGTDVRLTHALMAASSSLVSPELLEDSFELSELLNALLTLAGPEPAFWVPIFGLPFWTGMNVQLPGLIGAKTP